MSTEDVTIHRTTSFIRPSTLSSYTPIAVLHFSVSNYSLSSVLGCSAFTVHNDSAQSFGDIFLTVSCNWLQRTVSSVYQEFDFYLLYIFKFANDTNSKMLMNHKCYKKAQLSLTNPRDACVMFARSM